VIREDNVAGVYKEIMISIGVEIHQEKTLVSSDTFEFAKRLFSDGVEISPLPLLGIVEGLSARF